MSARETVETVDQVAGRRVTGDPEVTVCPRGPVLLRGATSVEDAEGRAHAVRRPVVAVCVCGKTQREPWCDGTHKVLRPR